MNLRLIFKKAAKILAIVLIAVIHLNLIPSLPEFFSCFNIIILTLVLVLILYDLKFAFYLAIFFGFLLDIYSSNFFGLNIIALVLTVIITNFFLIRFFTNKSIYSFISLTIIAVISYELPKAIFLFLVNFITKDISDYLIFSSEYFSNLVYEIIINALVMLIVFYLINYFSRRLKSMFVAK